MYTEENENTAYRLALSPLKKINGEWISEQESLVLGSVKRKTIELGRPYGLKNAWLQVQSVFSGENAALIYACEAMSCGSSNAWANERFAVKQLYGLDLSQFYQVWELNRHGVKQLAVVYLVQRGNKRIYFQQDIITPKNQTISFVPSEEVVAKTFYRDKQVEIAGLSFEQGKVRINEKYLASYAKAFNQQPFRSLMIVGHDYLSDDEAANRTRSESYAKVVRDALVALGVQSKRIQVRGAGSLSPVTDSRNARVVVLLR
ncbi:MAG: DUF4892 domain-containing protein [Agarilytica sp.]